MKKLAVLFTLSILQICSYAQSPTPRPRILGIDHVSFYTTAPDGVKKLYADVLGLAPADPVEPGGTLRYMVGRQWVGYSPAPDPKSTDRMDHVALRTDNIAALHKYLIAQGINVPHIEGRADHSLFFFVTDPEGHKIEFVERGQSEAQSTVGVRGFRHMIHAGFLVYHQDEKITSTATSSAFARSAWRSRPTSPRLQASVSTIEHHERPDYLDRLSLLRDQVFALDHMFMSLFGTVGWLIRLGLTVVLLASVHVALIGLVFLAIPIVITSTWRPGVERVVEERVAPHDRSARHLFTLGTTAPAGKEIRLAGIGPSLTGERRSEWDQWFDEMGPVRWSSAAWHSLAWAVFGLGYVGGIVFVAQGLKSSEAAVLLVVVAGGRLSQYVAAAVGELGFLRGIWLDSARRLAWLEDYAAAIDEDADLEPPDRLTDGIRFEHVSFRYPGTERVVLEDVDLHLPAGAVVAIVGENGAGKTTLVKLLARMYAPTEGRILVDGIDLARIPSAEWRERLAGAFQDFYRFELLAQATVGLGDEPRIEDRPAVDTRGRPGRRRRPARRSSRAGLDTQLGPGWDRRRRGLPRSVAEALARPRVHARPTARARARRADRRARRGDRARALRALRRRGARRRGRTAASRCSSPTASRPCAWPTSSSCSTARTSSRSAATRTSWPTAAPTPSCTRSRPTPTADPGKLAR